MEVILLRAVKISRFEHLFVVVSNNWNGKANMSWKKVLLGEKRSFLSASGAVPRPSAPIYLFVRVSRKMRANTDEYKTLKFCNIAS